MMWKIIYMVLPLAFLLPGVIAKCTPGDGYFLKTTRVIPRNYKEYLKFTKDIKCVPDDLQVHYAVGSWGMETLMGCFCSRPIFGDCLEMNNGTKWTIQPLQHANCTVFDLSPCNGTYISVFSYLWFQCFDIYGGNLSLEYVTNQNDLLKKENQELKNDIAIQTNNKVYDNINYWAIFCVVFLVLFILSVVVNIYQYKTSSTCKSKDKHKSVKMESIKSEDVQMEELNPSNTGTNIVVLIPSNTQPEDSGYKDMNKKDNIYRTLNSKGSKIFSDDTHENSIDVALVENSVKNNIELYQ